MNKATLHLDLVQFNPRFTSQELGIFFRQLPFIAGNLKSL